MSQQDAILTDQQIADLDTTLKAIHSQLWDAQRAYDEAVRQKIAARVADLDDGFWLVQARIVLGRMCDDPTWRSSWLGSDVANACTHLDQIIRAMDERSRQGGAT